MTLAGYALLPAEMNVIIIIICKDEVGIFLFLCNIVDVQKEQIDEKFPCLHRSEQRRDARTFSRFRLQVNTNLRVICQRSIVIDRLERTIS